MKQWFSGMRKELHVLGPLLPVGYGTKRQNTEEGASDDIEAFLGKMLVQYGKQSVYFVRLFPFFKSVPTNFFLDILRNYLLGHGFGVPR
jgi:hypothetical protein